jgi:O-acetylhomoserine (thiol)-lyase
MKKDIHGALRFPVYDSVAFEFESARDIQLAFEGRKMAHSYTRISNPTVEDFENRVRLLSDAQGVVAVSSGMAAISNLVLAIADAGSNIVTTRYLFGNTYSLFENTLKPWGLETRYVNLDNLDEIRASIDEKTRCIFTEIITNPQLQVPDVRAISEIAKSRNIPLVVDGTVTTPFLFKSGAHGVDVEILSTTKYMSGGATSIGGVIIDNGSYNWKKCPKLKEATGKYGPFALITKLKREVYRDLGSCLSPNNAYLQSLGMETMGLRIERSCSNALKLAGYLEGTAKAGNVNYPGLESSPYHELGKTQFEGGCGGILTFELESREACFSFMDNLKLIKRSTNINDNKTLILHPATTIFCEYSEAERAAMGVGDSMLRLSVGIEDVEDIREDINLGMETIY